MINDWAKSACLRALKTLDGGVLRLECPSDSYLLGDGQPGVDATLTVHNERFFWRALTAGDIGIGEAYVDGDWTTPDLVALVRLLLKSRHVLERRARFIGAVKTAAASIGRRLRDNSLAGSRRHIHRHYDLGNDFFGLFLDSTLRMYSSAYFASSSDTLETAQTTKVDRICRMLDLKPTDRVLEIGSGWGGFASWAASRYGCHITTTTISDEQYRYVREWKASAGEVGARVEILRADYRELVGTFDKIVSIEMFEAVGLKHYDEFFAAVSRLLAPAGAMVLQTITVDDQWFPRYHGSPDWIERYIFPGGELASIGGIVDSVARATDLSMYAAENFGRHYALTLRAWRSRFRAQLDPIREMGLDDRFIRMWDFYLAICEAAFLERHTGVYQLLLVKNGCRRPMFNEPWNEPGLVDEANGLERSAA